MGNNAVHRPLDLDAFGGVEDPGAELHTRTGLRIAAVRAPTAPIVIATPVSIGAPPRSVSVNVPVPWPEIAQTEECAPRRSCA